MQFSNVLRGSSFGITHSLKQFAFAYTRRLHKDMLRQCFSCNYFVCNNHNNDTYIVYSIDVYVIKFSPRNKCVRDVTLGLR